MQKDSYKTFVTFSNQEENQSLSDKQLEEKLLKLKEFLSSGLITKNDYETKRKELLDKF